MERIKVLDHPYIKGKKESRETKGGKEISSSMSEREKSIPW